MGDDGPIPLSYHFAQGKFYGGNIRDKSLENMSLQDIAETLAKDMEEQNFFPASSTAEGDLLIVVHWGTTELEDDWDELLGEDGSEETLDENGESTLPSDDFDSNLGSELNYESQLSKRRENAILTGIDKGLDNSVMPSDYYEYSSMLEEERYFMVLIGFDWQALLKEKVKEVQFVTRFSLRSPGTNFEDAIPSLSRAAIPHLGTNLDDLAKTKTQLGWGKGSVGEIEVVKEIDAEELEEITKEEEEGLDVRRASAIAIALAQGVI